MLIVMAEDPATAPQPAIVHVDLDQFLAAVEVLRHPELVGRPVVVGGDGNPDRPRQVVATASYEARAFGVHSGMALAVARRKCPSAVFLPSDKPAYLAASERVMATLRRLGRTEVIGWDEAFVESSADPLEFAAEVIRRVAADNDLTCAVGIGETKLQAKTATGFAKVIGRPGDPQRVARLTRSDWIATMGWRPVTALWGIGARTATRLSNLGINTVEQLARADTEVLATAFGPTIGPSLRILGLGGDDSPVDDRVRTAVGASKEITYTHDLTDWQEVRAEVHRLTRELIATNSRPITHIAVKLRTPSFFTRTKIAKRREGPTAAADEAVALADVVFERFEPFLRVRLVGVRLVFADG